MTKDVLASLTKEQRVAVRERIVGIFNNNHHILKKGLNEDIFRTLACSIIPEPEPVMVPLSCVIDLIDTINNCYDCIEGSAIEDSYNEFVTKNQDKLAAIKGE